jgi:hypothetical protein
VAVVPVTLLDVSGTPLDEGAGPDAEIQGFAFRVDFSPAAAVAAVEFRRAGATAGHQPVFPVVGEEGGGAYVLISFDEATAALDLSLDAPAPGDLVGELLVELTAGAPLSAAVRLTVDEATATLVNQSARVSESVAAGTLAVAGGAIILTGPAVIFADGFESGDTGAWSLAVP